MKKSLRTLMATLALSPFLVQCASQDDMHTLNYQLMTVNKKVEDMKLTTVDQMQRKQAVTSEQLDQLQQELLALGSKIDEVVHRNQLLSEENRELKNVMNAAVEQQSKENNQRFASLTELINKQQTVLTMQQDQIQVMQKARVDEARKRAQAAADRARAAREKKKSVSSRGTVTQLRATAKKRLITTSAPQSAPAAKKVKVGTTSVPTKAAKPAAQKAEAESTDRSDPLSLGRKALEQGRHQEAYEQFSQVLKGPAKNDDQATARFMMGETRFKQKQYDQAILEYQELISRHGGSSMAATALMRQAQSFEALSDNDTAKIIHKKILNSYPNSPEAAEIKARQEAAKQ